MSTFDESRFDENVTIYSDGTFDVDEEGITFEDIIKNVNKEIEKNIKLIPDTHNEEDYQEILDEIESLESLIELLNDDEDD